MYQEIVICLVAACDPFELAQLFFCILCLFIVFQLHYLHHEGSEAADIRIHRAYRRGPVIALSQWNYNKPLQVCSLLCVSFHIHQILSMIYLLCNSFLHNEDI